MRNVTIRSLTAVALAGLLAACASPSIKNTTDEPAGAATPASSSSAPANIAKLGSPITLKGNADGSQVQVTLLKVANPTTSTNDFEKPDAGKQYAAAQFRIKNTGTAPYTDSPSNGAKVTDSQDQQFGTTSVSDLAAGATFPGSVNLLPGKSVVGYIVFEIPKGAKLTAVEFGMDSGFAGIGQWTL